MLEKQIIVQEDFFWKTVLRTKPRTHEELSQNNIQVKIHIVENQDYENFWSGSKQIQLLLCLVEICKYQLCEIACSGQNHFYDQF